MGSPLAGWERVSPRRLKNRPFKCGCKCFSAGLSTFEPAYKMWKFGIFWLFQPIWGDLAEI